MLASPQPARRSVSCMLLFCLAAAAGCTVGPRFASPKTTVPDAWAGAEASSEAAGLSRWWAAFNDNALVSLVERAVQSNLDLRLAESRIRQARAGVKVAESGGGPTLDASASYSRSRSGAANASGQYRTGFDAAWEIDLFGGVRRGVEAAGAEVQSAEENRRDVLVTLAAEVAYDYVQLRAYQQRILIARRNLEAQKRSAALIREKFEGGFVGRLDVASADAQVASTTAQIPLLEASAQQTIHALSVLLDREPGALTQELAEPGEIPGAPPEAPLGVPADLLRRRPDVRRAEADIHAATARIGVATADLYPKVSIGGSLGWQAGNPGSLFGALSRFWSFGPSISWNLFNTGRTLSNIEIEKALEEQSILTYRQTVLTAIREVEDARVASAKEQERRKALLDAAAANRKAVELSTKLYAEGQTDYLNVISAQQGLYSSEDSLVQSTQAMSVDLIALYKALGGGWQESPAPESPQP